MPAAHGRSYGSRAAGASSGALDHAAAHVRVDQDTTWRMFFKQKTRDEVLTAMAVGGRADLARPFAGVLAVMA